MSKKKVASEESLGLLHKLLGDVFLHQVQTELDGINSGDEDYFSTFTPAMATTILKYLDASNITCAVEDDDSQSELSKKLAKIRSRNKDSKNIFDINKAVNED